MTKRDSVDDRSREGWADANLGNTYQILGSFEKAIEYHEKHLKIAKEAGDRSGVGETYGKLGNAYQSLGNFQKAIEYHEKHLKTAKQLSNRSGEGKAYGNLGNAYESLGNFQKAIEYHEKDLKIKKEVGDRTGEGGAYANLGNAYDSLGNFQKAIEYHEKHLEIAREVGDRFIEGRAYGNLGKAYQSLGYFLKAIEYHETDLKRAKEVGNTAGEGCAYGNLGNAYHSLGNFQKAIEYHEKALKIAKEVGSRPGEGGAYANLGNAYDNLGNFQKATEYHEKHLKIAKEVGDRSGEGKAYGNLGNAFQGLGNVHKAKEYHEKRLKIAKEVGDKAGAGRAYGNLGSVYKHLGNFQKAIEYHEKHLKIAKEAGERPEEGPVYGNLGNVYQNLGNFQKAIEYHEKHLKIAKEIGDRPGEGSAYGNLGNAYQSLGNFQKSIEYYEKYLKIAKEVGDISGEGRAYGNLGNAYASLGKFQKAIKYHEKFLKIAKQIGDRADEGRAYGNLGNAYGNLDNFEKAIEYQEKRLKIAKEVGDRFGEGMAYGNLGHTYEDLGKFQEAFKCFQASVNILDTVRVSITREDALKISFRDRYCSAYSGLWQSLLKLGRIDESLCAAEQGRAQTLADALKRQYGLTESPPASLDPKETISYISSKLSTKTVFLGHMHNKITFWVISKGSKVEFREKKLEQGGMHKDAVTVLLNTTLEKIGVRVRVKCENRSLDELNNRNFDDNDEEDDDKQRVPSQSTISALQPLHDAILGPIADLCQGNELIIVPDGPLCLAPFSALSTSICIRTVPSLTSLRLITDCPEDCKSKQEALLVGDPYLGDVKKPRFNELPCAKEEVEMIGEILKIQPLTGTEATKEEVLKRITSAALVHIAAHGREGTGEIALAPNSGWENRYERNSRSKARNKGPKEEDFVLKMSDVEAVKLRAKLVVLSCCHSGRGEIKSEGVVGIARAFLAAGARSVLASLWAIEDQATLEFMKSFYERLGDGKTASVALHQAMKCLRESEKFCAVRNWAPFTLIGDDIHLNLDAKKESAEMMLEKCKFSFSNVVVVVVVF